MSIEERDVMFKSGKPSPPPGSQSLRSRRWALRSISHITCSLCVRDISILPVFGA